MDELNSIARELNETLRYSNPRIFDMLSGMGKALFFPKGILSQSAEAKEKAYRTNATIGIAKEKGSVMGLSAVTSLITGLNPDEYLPYAPSFGVKKLREKWRQEIFRKNPSLKGDAVSLPIVTSGVTHAISVFADMWIDPGDTVLLPDMMWGNYNMTLAVRRGAKIKQYKTFDDSLSAYNVAAFEAAVKKEAESASKVIVVLNFPHNPSGYSLSSDEARRVAGILTSVAESGTNVVAAFDDAYFGLFYEADTMKESLFSRLAGSHERMVAVKLDGATKEDYVWGFRTGFITYGISAGKDNGKVCDALEKKTAGCIRGSISNASNLSQVLLLKSLSHESYRQEKAAKYTLLKQRAQTIKEVLRDSAYRGAWDVYPFNSGYFMCLRLRDVNAEELRCHLLDAYGTGLISMGETNLRIAFSCIEQEEIKPLFDTILKGVNDLRDKKRK